MSFAKSLGFGVVIGLIAAAITATVILIINDKNKNKVGYKAKSVWENAAIAAAIGLILGFGGSFIKNRASVKKAASTAKAGAAKVVSYWQNPATPATGGATQSE